MACEDPRALKQLKNRYFLPSSSSSTSLKKQMACDSWGKKELRVLFMDPGHINTRRQTYIAWVFLGFANSLRFGLQEDPLPLAAF